jgi:predicted kinase
MVRLVIVSGAPGAGKTTLARLLAAELAMPLIVRDDIKEALMDALGCDSLERSTELGRGSYAAMYAVLRELLRSGAGAIVETNFRRGTSESELRPFVEQSDAVLVHCESADIRVRFLNRARHPGHLGQAVAERLMRELNAGLFEPIELGIPTLRVDCSDSYRPPLRDVVAFVGQPRRERFGGTTTPKKDA